MNRMDQPTAIPTVEPGDAWCTDKNTLGELVDAVVQEQGGPALFAAVEYLLTEVRSLRSGKHRDLNRERGLFRWAQQLPTERLLQMVRAFSVSFHLMNLVEQQQ